MDVHPVMERVVMQCFFRQNNRCVGCIALGFAIWVLMTGLLTSGCQNSKLDTTAPVLGQYSDLTEDLHHRLQAGLFVPGKDPVVAHIIRHEKRIDKLRLPFINEDAPHTNVRISWERGSFWVKSDDHAHVVIYMDWEATLSHVQLTTFKGFGNSRVFSDRDKIPIR